MPNQHNTYWCMHTHVVCITMLVLATVTCMHMRAPAVLRGLMLSLSCHVTGPRSCVCASSIHGVERTDELTHTSRSEPVMLNRQTLIGLCSNVARARAYAYVLFASLCLNHARSFLPIDTRETLKEVRALRLCKYVSVRCMDLSSICTWIGGTSETSCTTVHTCLCIHKFIPIYMAISHITAALHSSPFHSFMNLRLIAVVAMHNCVYPLVAIRHGSFVALLHQQDHASDD